MSERFSQHPCYNKQPIALVTLSSSTYLFKMIKTTDENISACGECRRGANSGQWPPPARVATRKDGPTFLHLCEKCGTYWHFDLRFATPIPEEKAREIYPSFFKL